LLYIDLAMTRRSRIVTQLIVAVLAIGAIGVFIYFQTRPGQAQLGAPGAPAAPPARAVPVLVAEVARRDVPVWLEGLGTVAAWQQVMVKPQVDGMLERVFFREGQRVKKGDLLAQIDPRPFLAQLHQAEGALARDLAQLQAGKLDLQRYYQLDKRDLITKQQVDQQAGAVGQTEGAVQVDRAQIESAKLNLDYAGIKAPLSGVTGFRLVDPGNLVRQTDPTGIVVLTQLDPAAVLLTLPQDDLPKVVAAQRRGPAVVEAWSRDGRSLLGKGKLVVIDNQINVSTSTLRLKAKVPNPDSILWPNQFVKARVLVDTERNALVLPASSVQRGPQGTFVYTVERDDTATVKPVEVGLTTAESVIIRKGVSAGDRVVIEGQNQLRPGAKVMPRPAAAATGTSPATGGKQDGGPAPPGQRPEGKRAGDR
jgi:multidrug efflux system membrane fusion protein